MVDYNTKITEIENNIPSIIGLVTTLPCLIVWRRGGASNKMRQLGIFRSFSYNNQIDLKVFSQIYNMTFNPTIRHKSIQKPQRLKIKYLLLLM